MPELSDDPRICPLCLSLLCQEALHQVPVIISSAPTAARGCTTLIQISCREITTDRSSAHGGDSRDHWRKHAGY